MIGDVSARMAVESLRSGVPNRHVVEQLGTTQREIQQQFLDLLLKAEEGQPAEPLLFTASFGQGKSHLLNYLRAQAMKRGFVTSFVVVSPEVPLGNAHVVLKAVSENAQVQDHTGVALRCLSQSARASSESFAALRIWANQASIRDRFKALLHIYDEFSMDPELRMQIVRDIEGQPLVKTLIRQKLKEINQVSAYDLQHPRNALLAHERIQVYARFAVACGAKGLVVFIDELERLAKFTRRQRMAAYSELGWWKAMAASEGAHLLPVFAANPAQIREAVEADGPQLDTPRYSQQASLFTTSDSDLAKAGIAMLRDAAMPLRNITANDREELKHRVRELYRRAYTAEAKEPPDAAVSTTVRADIRRWITFWDLQRYFGDVGGEVTESDVSFDSSEIRDDLLASDGADSGGDRPEDL